MRKLLIMVLLTIPMYLFSQVDTTGHIQVLTGYYNDLYSEPYSRAFHVFYGGVGYKSPNTTIYGKVNYNMLSLTDDQGELLTPKTSGLQYEFDYYQQLTKTTTSWWNYAYSNADGFPDHRFMMRIWQELPKAFLVSGGMGYYNFGNINSYSINGGIEKYLGNYWVEYRTFLYFQEPSNTTGHFITARRFIKDINYIQLMVGYGPNDDDPWDATTHSRLDAYRLGLLYVTNLGDRFRIRTGVNYMYENFNDNDWRNRYSFNIGLTFNIN